MKMGIINRRYRNSDYNANLLGSTLKEHLSSSGLEDSLERKGNSKVQDFAEKMKSQGITDRKTIFQKGKEKGFTLIELLVTVSIIGVLTGILLPALSSARNSARKLSCANNEREILQADTMYAMDHDGYIPRGNNEADNQVFMMGNVTPAVNMGKFAKSYLGKDLKVYFCPGDSAKQPKLNGKTWDEMYGTNEWGDYLWRNGSNMPRASGSNIPIMKSTLNNYAKHNYALIIDDNHLENYGKDNHGGDFANIGFPDGHVNGRADPEHKSYSGNGQAGLAGKGDLDKIFKWADKQY